MRTAPDECGSNAAAFSDSGSRVVITPIDKPTTAAPTATALRCQVRRSRRCSVWIRIEGARAMQDRKAPLHGEVHAADQNEQLGTLPDIVKLDVVTPVPDGTSFDL